MSKTRQHDAGASPVSQVMPVARRGCALRSATIMSRVFIPIIVASGILFAGCCSPEMVDAKKKATKIKAGMNRTQVYRSLLSAPHPKAPEIIAISGATVVTWAEQQQLSDRAYIPIMYRYRQYQFEHGSVEAILSGKKKFGKAVQNDGDLVLVVGKPVLR